MTTTTRRGLLSMFAAGAAAAILPSGLIMPVHPRIWTPDEIVRAHIEAAERYFASLRDATIERHLIGVDLATGPDVTVLAVVSDRQFQLLRRLA